MRFPAPEWARRIKTGSYSLKAVLRALADHADLNGVCWPSQETIAAEAELTERTVRTALGVLEERGFLTREERYDAAHRRRSDLIVLAIHRKDFPLVREYPESNSGPVAERPSAMNGFPSIAEAGSSTGIGGKRPERISGGSETSDRKLLPVVIPQATGNSFQKRPETLSGELLREELPLEKEEEKKEKKEKETRVDALCLLLSEFDTFWSFYPNKTKRLAAEKAFAKIQTIPNFVFADLMDGLKTYASKTDDRPWCNPDTWLKEHRWTDKPATVERTNGKLGWFERVRRSTEASEQRIRDLGLSENRSGGSELPGERIYPRLSRSRP